MANINLLEKTPDITQRELSEKTNISLRNIKRIIQQLKEKDKIKRVGSDRKGYLKINNGEK